MPCLQFDLSDHYPAEQKKRLAAKMCETYASMISVDIRRISVAIPELGEGAVWRIPAAGAEPMAYTYRLPFRSRVCCSAESRSRPDSLASPTSVHPRSGAVVFPPGPVD